MKAAGARRAGGRLTRRSLLAGAATALLATPCIGPVRAQEAPSLAPSGLTAPSVYVFDSTSNILLYAENQNERRPVGSLVKLTTALVVMELAEDLDEQVVIHETDLVDISMYSNMQLIEGDTLTVSLLLYGLLIPSANDGALALARHFGGKLTGSDDPGANRAAFIDRMNTFVRDHGLNDSNYETPDGTDTRDSYSSAHDVAILFSMVMQNERLRDIASQPAYRGTSVGPEKRVYEDPTTNEALGRSGIIAGKTGTTENAGACVALARETSADTTLIIAIVGSDATYDANGDLQTTRWDDVDALLAQIDETFTWVEPPDDATMPGLSDEMNVWQVETRDQVAIPMRTDDQAVAQLVLGAPVAAGEQAGTVGLYMGDVQLGSFPVYQAG